MSENTLGFDSVKTKSNVYKCLKGELQKTIKLHAGEAIVKKIVKL